MGKYEDKGEYRMEFIRKILLNNIKRIRLKNINRFYNNLKIAQEDISIPSKPSQVAYRLDYYGLRVIMFILNFILMVYFGLNPLFAVLGAVILTFIFQFGLKKKGKEGKEKLVNLELIKKASGLKSYRCRNQIILGLGLLVLGWIWNGIWGCYFAILGLINLFFAFTIGLKWQDTEITSQNVKIRK